MHFWLPGPSASAAFGTQAFLLDASFKTAGRAVHGLASPIFPGVNLTLDRDSSWLEGWFSSH